MASSAATLFMLHPKDVNTYSGGQAPLQRIGANGPAVLVFGKNPAAPDANVPEFVEFDFFLPKATTFSAPSSGGSPTVLNGYTATAGLRLRLFWSSRNKVSTGAVRWVANIVLVGATDLPDPTVDLWSGTYEDAVNTSATTSPAGGLTVTTIDVSIAHIQSGQATAPAAGDWCRMRIRREIGNANDTMAGDALLYAIEVRDN